MAWRRKTAREKTPEEKEVEKVVNHQLAYAQTLIDDLHTGLHELTHVFDEIAASGTSQGDNK